MTRLIFDIYLRSTPERVLEALADPVLVPRDRFGMSFPAEWKTGPIPSARSAGDDAGRGQRLVLEWLQTDHLETNGGRVSVATFDLSAMGDVTRLSVTHRDLAPDGSLIKVVTAGWPMLLSSLKSVVETGQPLAFGERLPPAA